MKKTDNPATNLSGKSLKLKKTKSQFWRWFWLTFLVLSLAYAWYSFYAPSNDVVWADDMVSARELAIDSDKNMLLFFTGEWCSPCRIMKREIFADEEVMKAINSQLVPVMIDVDDPKSKEVLEQYNVGGTPITIFTDSKGKVLDYAVGKIGKTKFLEMLEKLGTKEK
ncbi:thioredoxin fold domain-containing protein [uncultured Draconibacterium sp.]|uniref:thioredoxin family protein n=1 Tax=uncultured Draconibacterium sp. TaxID=1573823 RepID=UPI0025EE467C|nr:thioredoxin fold domain-containing protein [uncultured Draconibacterium sp.]